MRLRPSENAQARPTRWQSSTENLPYRCRCCRGTLALHSVVGRRRERLQGPTRNCEHMAPEKRIVSLSLARSHTHVWISGTFRGGPRWSPDSARNTAVSCMPTVCCLSMRVRYAGASAGTMGERSGGSGDQPIRAWLDFLEPGENWGERGVVRAVEICIAARARNKSSND